MAEAKVVDKPTLPVPKDTDQDVFELADRADEQLILAELSGRVTESYVYEFPTADGKVQGLTYLGTNWACREYAKCGEAIRIVSKPEIQQDLIDPEYIIVSVVAQRYAVNRETGRESALDSAVGVKRQWTKMEKRDKTIVFNKFFIEHGVSKAQRNAKQALLPTDFVKKMVIEALKLKNRPAGAAPPATRPAAAQAPPASAPPAAPATPAAPPKAADPMAALRQRFWTVIKKAGKATDEASCRKLLKELTGKEKASDLDEQTLKSVGGALSGVTTGANELQVLPDGTRQLVDKALNVILYPLRQAAPAPAPAAVEHDHNPEDEPPPPSQEEALF